MKEILNEEDDPSDAQVKPGVNFTNMFMCAFYVQRSLKRQKIVKSISVFLLFWNLVSFSSTFYTSLFYISLFSSYVLAFAKVQKHIHTKKRKRKLLLKLSTGCAKAAHKTLVKCQFTKILQATFLYETFCRSLTYVTFWLCYFLAKIYWHLSCS